MHVTCELPIGLGSYDATNDFQTGRKCQYTGKKGLELCFCVFFSVFCFSGRFQNRTEKNVYNSLNYTLLKNFIQERKESQNHYHSPSFSTLKRINVSTRLTPFWVCLFLRLFLNCTQILYPGYCGVKTYSDNQKDNKIKTK